MPAAEIIAIGTELLLGEIQDTNTRFLARLLRDAGVDLFRTTIIGDNPERIAQAIQESLTRCQIVITTGGLGPTVDDPTRQAVAQAFHVDLEFRPDLWAQIEERFVRFSRQPTENNRRQAYIPHGSIPVENPVGTAPCFIVETTSQSVVSLPGVPREMEYLMTHTVMPYLSKRFTLQDTIKATVLHCAGVGESQVDEWVADLETLVNPTVGLAAHPDQVDIRVTAKSSTVEEADRLISSVVSQIIQRLGPNIYGRDADTIESVVLHRLSELGLILCIHGWGPQLPVLESLQDDASLVKELSHSPEPVSLAEIRQVAHQHASQAGQVLLFSSFTPGPTQQRISLFILTPFHEYETERSYGGPPGYGPQWATMTTLDFIRRSLI